MWKPLLVGTFVAIASARIAGADSIAPTGLDDYTSAAASADFAVGDWIPPGATHEQLSVSAGSTGSRTVTDGYASATTSWDLSGSEISVEFAHATSGESGSYAYSRGGVVFTAESAASYSLDGIYTFADGDPSTSASERAFFGVWMREVGEPGNLLTSWQRSEHTDDGMFIVWGRNPSDVADSGQGFGGMGSGTLVAGHTYLFFYCAYVANGTSESAHPAWSGSGWLTLSFTSLTSGGGSGGLGGDGGTGGSGSGGGGAGGAGTSPVPEPATLALLGLGAAGLAVRRWRRRSGPNT